MNDVFVTISTSDVQRAASRRLKRQLSNVELDWLRNQTSAYIIKWMEEIIPRCGIEHMRRELQDLNNQS